MVESRVPATASGSWPVALVSAIPCASVPFVSCVLGYGAYVRVFSFLLIPILIASSGILFSSIRAIQSLVSRLRTGCRSQTPHLNPGRGWGILALWVILAGVSWSAGKHARMWHCESVCNKTRPFMESLEKYRTEHGSYPSKLEDLPGFGALLKRGKVTLRQGRFLRFGIDVGKVEDVEMTVYLEPHNYLCIVPMERKLIMSGTRFYVLQKDSRSPNWTEDHLVWTLSGS